ncbi:MAG: HAD family hydrolase [Phycisphaerales bacterium]|nr:MAG: HAD family hydrolase [Phycisphaerales bacterium]
MAIEAIVFDLDDTLVVEVASAEAAFLATCAHAKAKYGIDPRELCETVRTKARELWHKSPARPYCVSIGISSWEGLWGRFDGDDPSLRILKRWVPKYRHEAWSRALGAFGVEDRPFAGRLAAIFREERRRIHVVYPDAEPVLRELRPAYRLGLVTNGAPALQRDKLDGSGLEPYFDAVVISGEVGVGKPDREIFCMTLEKLGTQPETTVAVGNSLRTDIAGAQQAGLRSVWLNRDNRDRDGRVRPDYEINSLDQLHEYLRSC